MRKWLKRRGGIFLGFILERCLVVLELLLHIVGRKWLHQQQLLRPSFVLPIAGDQLLLLVGAPCPFLCLELGLLLLCLLLFQVHLIDLLGPLDLVLLQFGPLCVHVPLTALLLFLELNSVGFCILGDLLQFLSFFLNLDEPEFGDSLLNPIFALNLPLLAR